MTDIFKKEIEELENMDFQVFVSNAIQIAPESFKSDESLIEYTRKVFRVVDEMLAIDRITGYVRDAILAGVLLSDLAVNEDPKYSSIHPLLVRPLIEDFKGDLAVQLWEATLNIVEAHEGSKTPIDKLAPKPGTPEHLVALANQIVRSESIEVKI
ncbi:hypothetical protein [Oceanobacillus profundus]|uniref:Uncharacterized protein n=1 Tax=Oceanobacillus profundus TaxID=372463 RepID=A0A417YH02_9BACI|nr:hypothetical protein [Oceanobacillus profundus]MBR2245627.1 hypothetical protein [Bacilli bacterium]MBR3121345.1 hypothetical protein [Oceanobacillus sp.]RHW32032.1 hypothetical protein D1B32_12420 [Oceanobacillus profundus]